MPPEYSDHLLPSSRPEMAHVFGPMIYRVHMHQDIMVHMHPSTQAREPAHAPDRLSRVPNQPKTPNRVIRVEEELWRDYGEACEAEGTKRSDDLRAHMTRKVRAWKRKKADVGE
jgi:hypothetical protein